MLKVITPKFCSESAYQLKVSFFLKGNVFILLLQVVSRGRVDQKQKLTRNRVIQASTQPQLLGFKLFASRSFRTQIIMYHFGPF